MVRCFFVITSRSIGFASKRLVRSTPTAFTRLWFSIPQNAIDFWSFKSGKYSRGSSGGSLGVNVFGNGFDWHWNEEDSY